MSLKEQLQQSVKDAMRAGDKDRLGTLRMAMAAIKQREVDERITLDDAAVLALLEKMLKQRRDAEGQYRDAGRDDLADKEAQEITVISEFLPEPLSEDELNQIIAQVINDTDASGPAAMGQVMGALKPLIQGRADMRAVSALVKARLSS
jgi:uncharacterized protein YqeY